MCKSLLSIYRPRFNWARRRVGERAIIGGPQLQNKLTAVSQTGLERLKEVSASTTALPESGMEKNGCSSFPPLLVKAHSPEP